MRQFYKNLFFVVFVGCLTCVACLSKAQITVSTAFPSSYTYYSATAPGAIVFAVHNTNSADVRITTVGSYLPGNQYFNYTLWYHPTSLTGQPPAITLANGWVPLDTSEMTTSSDGVKDLFTGLNFILPSGTAYRFAVVGGPDSFPYYAGALLTPNNYTGSGVSIYTQDNTNSPGYAGPATGTLGNTPRGFVGKIVFEPILPCANPDAGLAISSAPRVCQGSSFSLDLQNATLGTGQSYLWQSSTDGNTWTDMGTATSSSTRTLTQTATTFYRAIVSCGTLADTSTSVQVLNGTAVSGAYTMNPAQATGGSNFASFADAIAHMSCGISGPITFEVEPGSVFTEQVTFPQITGASATNRITFRGNGATIQFAPVTGARHVVKLNGIDYMTLDSFNIVSTDATYGWGVHVMNASNNDSIKNSTINVSAVTSTGTTNSGGIVVSNSSTSVTTLGNNASNLVIYKNEIIGGYTGVNLVGNTDATNASNNRVIGNIIRDFYADGIVLDEQNGALVSENNIHRTNRNDVTTFTGIEVSGATKNIVVNSNRIHDTHNAATTQSGAAYGIYSTANDAPVGSENKFTNNLIYNFNSGTGTIYGIYNTGSDGAWYYHNTIVLDHAAATSGTTRGLYQTTAATNIQFKNNIVVINRGGTGSKHAVYLGTTTSTIASDYNVLVNSSTTGTTNAIGYYSTNFPTLADWKTANGNAYDQNSVSVNPMFVDPSTGDFTPTEPAINGIGTNVGVTTDILGNSRTTTPDPGAYEFTITGKDASITWVSPVMPTGTGAKTVTVNITNTQTSTITSLNLSYTDGANTQTQSFTGLNIAPSASQQLSFTTQYNFTQSVALRAYINTVNGSIDNNQSNDTTALIYLCLPLSGNYVINSGAAPGTPNTFRSFNEAATYLNCGGVSGPVTITVTPGSGPYIEQVTFGNVTGSSATNRITIKGNGETIEYVPSAGARYIVRLDGTDYMTIDSLVVKSTDATYGWGIQLSNGANFDSIYRCTIDMSAITSTTADNSVGIVGSNSSTDVNGDGNASNLVIYDNTLIGGYSSVVLNGSATAQNAYFNRIIDNNIRDFYSIGVELTDNDSSIIARNDINRATKTAVGTFEGVELGTGNQNVLVEGNFIHDTHNAATTTSGTAYGLFSSANDAPVGKENKFVNNLLYNFNSLTGTVYAIYNSGSNGVRYYHNTVVIDFASASSGTTRGFYQTTEANNIEFKNNIIYITRGGTGVKYNMYFGTATSTIVSDNNVLYNAASGGTNGIGYFSTGFTTLADWKTANAAAWDQNSISVDPMFVNASSNDFTPSAAAVNGAGQNLGVTTDIFGNARTASPDPGAIEFSLAGLDASVMWVGPTMPVTAGAQTIQVSVTNTQTTAITSLNMSYTDGSSVVTQSFTGLNITAGNTQQFTFTTPYNMTASTLMRAYINTVNGVTDNSQVNDTTAWQTFCLPMSGNYTINSLAPAGTANTFSSFTQAVSFLTCGGISGPVTITVEPGSGPYNEQITIPAITGASATNRITFKGNGEIIQFNTVTSARHVIELDGADYVTIDSLSIKALGTTYAWPIHMANGANYDTIMNSIIDASANTSTTADNSGGIVVANSTSDIQAEGSASYNVIINNQIIGGYHGVIINGTATGLNAKFNQVINNTIRDFYSIGVALVDNDSTFVTGNDINRATKTTVGSFEGIQLSGGNKNLMIASNRIHSTHTAATTLSGSAYGVYSTANDAPAGSENKVINNLIYNFNSETGTIYGIYNSSSDGFKYYHNTIVLNHAAATAGTTRGFYQTSAASNIEFKNNIVYITRGGTGVKYNLYFGTTGSTIASNNNVLHMGSTAGTNAIGYYSAAQTTLANWKAVNGGAYDQQSKDDDPMFTDPANLNFTPTNTAIDTMGVAVGVTVDINGLTRDPLTPDVGALEFGVTMPVSGLTLSGDKQADFNRLSWSTVTEVNNAGFVVERSANGINFGKLGYVATKAEGGNSNQLLQYNYVDAAPLAGINYYRLKQVDKDGRSTYSNVVAIKGATPQSMILSNLYPNPASDRVNLVLSSPRAEKVQVVITDVTGKVLYSEARQILAGENNLTVNVAALSQGSYFIKVTCNSGCEAATRKFIK